MSHFIRRIIARYADADITQHMPCHNIMIRALMLLPFLMLIIDIDVMPLHNMSLLPHTAAGVCCIDADATPSSPSSIRCHHTLRLISLRSILSIFHVIVSTPANISSRLRQSLSLIINAINQQPAADADFRYAINADDLLMLHFTFAHFGRHFTRFHRYHHHLTSCRYRFRCHGVIAA